MVVLKGLANGGGDVREERRNESWGHEILRRVRMTSSRLGDLLKEGQGIGDCFMEKSLFRVWGF